MTTTQGKRAKGAEARVEEAEVAREEVPFDDRGQVHGVTFDGRHVWFARNDEIVAFDPETSRVVRRIPLPGARAGTAFDGRHVYQLAGAEILVVDLDSGAIVRRLPTPPEAHCSGMAWADGYLFLGKYGRDGGVLKVDARTGEVVKTMSSDRLVTGVSCVGGELWHGVSDDGCELRRLAPDGTVEERLAVPVKHISGVERAGDAFWCGGEQGTLRLVRRKRRAGA